MSSVVFPGQEWESGSKAPRKTSRTLHRAFVVIVCVLATVAVLQLTYHLVIAPRMVIRQVEVEISESLGLSRNRLMALAGLPEARYYTDVDPREIETNLLRHPAIAEAKVDKQFPDTLVLKLVKRKPLALTLVAAQDGALPLALDSEGVFYEAEGSLGDEDLPVISGLNLGGIKLGDKIDPLYRRYLEDLDEIRSETPELYRLISELKFVKKDNADFEVLLYTESHRIPVRLDRTLDAHRLRYMFLVLDVLARQGVVPGVEELDFRSGQVVTRYATKERIDG